MPLQELTREFAEAVARQHPALQTLSLARNALSHVRFLELLPPLRRLDLSGNALRALPAETAEWGLSLEFLDLSDNALESLQQLRFCRALVTLRAGGNRIALFSELKFLQPLDALQELTLEGNPIATQPFYRREVVAMLPQLQRFDGRVVTPAERLVASLQQKPLLTTTAAVADDIAPAETLATVSPELDLSGASDVWSTGQVASGPWSPLPHATSSVASSSSSFSVARSPQRPLLTPASLRQTTSLHARPVASRDVSIQVTSSASPRELVRAPDRPRETAEEPVALLQSRVSALETILALQDKMLADELAQLAEQQTKDPERAARLYTQLLATWRHKVVALMVQLKSMELQSSPNGKPSPTAAAATAAMEDAERQLEIWKQKCTDALAQRDLERVRTEQAQRQRDGAETKIVRVVRTLATERQRVQTMAEDVALFAAKEGVMTSHMDALVHETQRLAAFEMRLRLLSERLKLASRLVAHREARLRNSEAAIEAERRVHQHRQNTMDASGSRRTKPPPLLLLRSATEQALRLLFHRLDPYHTGLVVTAKLLDAMRCDLAVGDALGGDETGESKRQRLVEHMEKAVRARSPFGGVSGTLTWGEVLLIFMPMAETLQLDEVARVGDGRARLALTMGELGVPRPFDEDQEGAANTTPLAQRKQTKLDKQALQTLSKAELVTLVTSLRADREQLQRRIMEDAQHLQRRVQGVEQQWGRKADELARTNEELQQQLARHTERAAASQQKLEDAERAAGEAQYQLQSLRRQLSEQTTSFATQKAELEAQCHESVERERLVWQRELQDVAFQQTQLQAENAKLELTLRQLERELAKQREQRETNGSLRVQQLQEKLGKRDDEIAKLRRERNTILNTLREHERKIAQQAAEQALVHATDATTQTSNDRTAGDGTRSVGVQVALLTGDRPVPTPDRRMRLEEIAPPPPAAKTPASVSIANDLRTRLQHLESLTESLLAD